MKELLSIAIALFAGLLMTRAVHKFNMPDVTAYLIAGLLIGPFFIGRMNISGIGFQTYEQLDNLNSLCDIALGFIAFSIGNEFRTEEVKKIGKQATIVGVLQAVITTAVVDIVLCIVHNIKPDLISLPAAITLGAVAAATAPAATLMVIHQYKAEGEITKILLPVVALDDAVGLVIFSFSIGIAKAITVGTANVAEIVFEPIAEIALSLALGSLCGFILTKLEAKFHSNTNRNSLIVTFVILTVAIAKAIIHFGKLECGFSSLLVCMTMGVVFCNTCPLSEDMMGRCDRWSSPILMLFFVLSGAELQLSMLKSKNVLIIGAAYILSRTIGKILGASLSSRLAKCSKNIIDHLGFALLPQAGVALGMSSIAIDALGKTDGTLVRNITLFGVLIYELVGPTITKVTLIKSGDIKQKSQEIINRRANAIASKAK